MSIAGVNPRPRGSRCRDGQIFRPMSGCELKGRQVTNSAREHWHKNTCRSKGWGRARKKEMALVKKMELVAGQGIAYSLKIVCLFILSTNIAMAAQYVSHLGSRDAARSACLAETSVLVNSYGGEPCRFESYYGSRKFYFTFCSIGERRTGCSYKSNYHKFTYPIPYEESVMDQYYETRQDLNSACTADSSYGIGYGNYLIDHLKNGWPLA